LNPTQLALDSVTSIRERNRASKLFNHLATVGEGISALGWVTMDGAEAAKYVGEMRDASQFYGNRVVREYKDTYPNKLSKLTIVARQSIKNGKHHSLKS
jgi:adenylyl cyclase-associated protein